jgi:hypothetical protein
VGTKRLRLRIFVTAGAARAQYCCQSVSGTGRERGVCLSAPAS